MNRTTEEHVIDPVHVFPTVRSENNRQRKLSTITTKTVWRDGYKPGLSTGYSRWFSEEERYSGRVGAIYGMACDRK